MPSREIWVFAEYGEDEVASVTLEMLSEARRLTKYLNGKICACLIGYKVGEYIPPLQNYGAEKVYLIDNMIFSEYSLDAYALALQSLTQKYNPLITMFGATSFGSELAPTIAARLKLPCITEVKRIRVDGKNLVITKSCYHEKVYQNFDFCPERTVILTVLPGDMDSEKAGVPNGTEVVNEEIIFKQEMIRTRNIKFIKGDPRRIRLEEAGLIIAGGKGIGKSIAILEDLADILGASIGGTRPIVDDGVIPFERQIGITGKSVAPKLLMACGISGAREFIAGMEKAALTIAINKDAKAPIFKFANFSIIGDLHQIIPILTHQIKVLRHKENKVR